MEKFTLKMEVSSSFKACLPDYLPPCHRKQGTLYAAMITSNSTYCVFPALSSELADDSAWGQIAPKKQAGLELNTTSSKSRATQARIPRGVELIAWPMLVHPLLHVTLIHKVQLVTLQTQPRSENRSQCSEVPSLTKQLWSNLYMFTLRIKTLYSLPKTRKT